MLRIIYSLVLWGLVLIIIPAVLYLSAYFGSTLSRHRIRTKDTFLAYAGSFLPLGLMMWVAFVIPMLFVNTTFILQSVSDPFGWGWNFFGTANIPWHQFLPQFIPWLQALIILTGYYLSLRNILGTWDHRGIKNKELFRLSLPIGIFITVTASLMLLFFTN